MVDQRRQPETSDAERPTNAQSGEQPIPEESIRNRAHEIYKRRGAEPGHDMDDWLQAESELRPGRKQDT